MPRLHSCLVAVDDPLLTYKPLKYARWWKCRSDRITKVRNGKRWQIWRISEKLEVQRYHSYFNDDQICRCITDGNATTLRSGNCQTSGHKETKVRVLKRWKCRMVIMRRLTTVTWDSSWQFKRISMVVILRSVLLIVFTEWHAKICDVQHW
jgi:hypothetical protein